MNHDRKTHFFLRQWTAATPLTWVWAWALLHFWAEFLMGQIGRINVTEILELQREMTKKAWNSGLVQIISRVKIIATVISCGGGGATGGGGYSVRGGI